MTCSQWSSLQDAHKQPRIRLAFLARRADCFASCCTGEVQGIVVSKSSYEFVRLPTTPVFATVDLPAPEPPELGERSFSTAPGPEASGLTPREDRSVPAGLLSGVSW
ncbi:hypothetical protein MGG_18061 [Pyricularia oryzae 70-15]|uniref:Uncharacterized protein n=1 Tax=Pyricularia oryzae (strain 70-15 / ATCC MYA-4617 / FGSC 8958) TaxID=242507 RepID=G4NKW3_PYRO7|nr:uncharacterized protein MGG_18061 [Pyricularia oryzae 70-15]EHA46655.1 hypothetical protein MGG_18061 [Pyricularia oryzae 70-15]